jgi:hypothetical protein
MWLVAVDVLVAVEEPGIDSGEIAVTSPPCRARRTMRLMSSPVTAALTALRALRPVVNGP